MQRIFSSFFISSYLEVKHKLLEWTAKFDVCCFLDNHDYASTHHSYNCLVGAGSSVVFQPDENFFFSLSRFESKADDWIFGHFNYELMNKVEKNDSGKPDSISFPEFFLYVPEIVIQLDKDKISIGVLDANADAVLNEIMQQTVTSKNKYKAAFRNRIKRNEYTETVNKLKQHIKYGDCYEINYCQEFYAENTFIDPVDVYRQLTDISPNPFSCFYRLADKHVLCASPERYVKKMGDTIFSQPIKGTSARNPNNSRLDEISKRHLQESEKEKRENVIIVDLVRNDLSKICKAGTVTVEEMFGVYSFPNVHQMISTIKGQLNHDTDLSEVVQATFPMGSMTGAPKKKVMQLLEIYEQTKRGIYSGTIGYVSPDGDFDFNVVIRTIVYNAQNGYISYHAGSAITYLSDPHTEYEECLMKAAAIVKVFSNA